MRSGIIQIRDGKRYHSGIFGRYWSLTPNSNGIYGFDLDVAALAVDSSSGYDRWGGFPLRCLGS